MRATIQARIRHQTGDALGTDLIGIFLVDQHQWGDAGMIERHAGKAFSMMRGMFCLTLKNPAVACGQIAWANRPAVKVAMFCASAG